MKAMKKLISTLVSLACGVGMTVPAFVSAEGLFPEVDPTRTVYSSADINRNGTVNNTDLLTLRMCLKGQKFINSHALLDVDGNNIISYPDTVAISNKIASTSYWNYVDGFNISFNVHNTNMYYAPSYPYKTTSETYYKHTFANGSGTSNDTSYTLSMTETPLSQTMGDPDIIIGENDLTPESDNDLLSGICRLSTGSTGFVVGDHVIATAAHCCINENQNSWENGLYFQFPSSSGIVDQNNATKYYAKQAHIDSTYYQFTFNNVLPDDIVVHDYALITVSEDLSNHYHFKLGVPYNMYSSSAFSWYNIYVTGFPTDYAPGLHTAFDKLYTNNQSTPATLRYKTDTIGGNSGSPVYVLEEYRNGSTNEYTFTVIAIHARRDPAGNYNTGPCITPIMLKFYYNNSNIAY